MESPSEKTPEIRIKTDSGFTLAEVMIAMSLFAVVATVISGLLVDSVSLEKRNSVLSTIYGDADIILSQITNEIQRGTIDYEEYYSVKVAQAKKPLAGGPFYGIYYGAYASRFYNPGKSHYPAPDNGSLNPDDLGIECSYPDPLPEGGICEIYYTNSTDFNTGQNPFKNTTNDKDDATAVCDKNFGISCVNVSNEVGELYLLDSSGTHKTIIARKKMTDTDAAIGMVRMTGRDLDQNGVPDVFGCNYEFQCQANGIFDIIRYPFIQAMGVADGSKYLADNNISLPQHSDLDIAFEPNTAQFVPFTPKKVDVKDLKFFINPLDDPYRSYSEENMQVHPMVTVVMTLGLTEAAKEDYPGEFADITVQATTAAGVVGKIDSYPPVSDVIRDATDKSWIYEAFN